MSTRKSAAAIGALCVAMIGGLATPASGSVDGVDSSAPIVVSPSAKTKAWMIPRVRSVEVTGGSTSILLSVEVNSSKKLRKQRYSYIEVRGGGDRCLITRVRASGSCMLRLDRGTESVVIQARSNIQGEWKRWSRKRSFDVIMSGPGPTPEPPIGGNDALSVLAMLTVSTEVRTGYDRALFRHWIDADGDGCDTREEVLLAESTIPAQVSTGCRITSGRWVSAFDGVQTLDPSTFDVDHLVPLAEAWDSGARRWNAATRQAFANDLEFEGSLIAVSASSNRSKGDRDPAEWLPAKDSYRCTYVTTWVAVKYRWSLSIDPVESNALRRDLTSCGNPVIALPARALTAES